ncbi:MAG: UbiX family flavin prenyltransferase [Phascolarctobacterium sp.]|nr:UbiX family flavin prenyltransferase [Phascolarctobacterium sp.]
MKKLIIGMSGADGVCLGVRLLELLKQIEDVETHLVMTPSAEKNLLIEGDKTPDEVRALADFVYESDDMAATIASGSFVTEGMLIVPCSMKSLAALTSGYTDNLLQRAADVCMKENRKIVLVPREMPLGRVHLRNLLAANELGCTIVPPVLTFYNKPQSIQDHIDHILGKALMQFGINLPNFKAWKGVQNG